MEDCFKADDGFLRGFTSVIGFERRLAPHYRCLVLTNLLSRASLFCDSSSGIFNDICCRNSFDFQHLGSPLFHLLLDRAVYLTCIYRATPAVILFIKGCVQIKEGRCRTSSFQSLVDLIGTGPLPESFPHQPPSPPASLPSSLFPSSLPPTQLFSLALQLRMKSPRRSCSTGRWSKS